jgi:hypothetical protein
MMHAIAKKDEEEKAKREKRNVIMTGDNASYIENKK